MNGYVAVLDSIPEQSIAVAVYLLGSLIALWCWYGVTKRLPKPGRFFVDCSLCYSADTDGIGRAERLYRTSDFWLAIWGVDQRITADLD